MVNVDGDGIGALPYASSTLGGFIGYSSPLPQGAAVPTAVFRMRGWNTMSLDWKYWTAYGTPEPTPPVALAPCVYITVTSSWE